MKNTKTKNKKGAVKTHVKVAKGVYMMPSGNYIVRKQINGDSINTTFTNKTKAIKFYNSL